MSSLWCEAGLSWCNRVVEEYSCRGRVIVISIRSEHSMAGQYNKRECLFEGFAVCNGTPLTAHITSRMHKSLCNCWL